MSAKFLASCPRIYRYQEFLLEIKFKELKKMNVRDLNYIQVKFNSKLFELFSYQYFNSSIEFRRNLSKLTANNSSILFPLMDLTRFVQVGWKSFQQGGSQHLENLVIVHTLPTLFILWGTQFQIIFVAFQHDFARIIHLNTLF